MQGFPRGEFTDRNVDPHVVRRRDVLPPDMTLAEAKSTGPGVRETFARRRWVGCFGFGQRSAAPLTMTRGT